MDFDEVDAGLFLGSRRALKSFLSSQSGVTLSVLTVESEDLTEVLQEVNQHLFVQVDDVKDGDLLSHFDDMLAFIEDGLRDGVVYVHCRHGVSRSAAVCAAFLMRRYGLDPGQAVDRLRLSRPFVTPNAGFMQQLELYARLGCRGSLQKPIYRRYRLGVAGRAAAADPASQSALVTPLVLPDPDMAGAVAAVYRCRQCRTALFSQLSVVDGQDVEKPDSGGDGSLRVLPLPWMAGVAGQPNGRLKCHKCSCKLGAFSWAPEPQPALLGLPEPSFRVTRSRVDRCLPRSATS
ncbi:dual specificity protein phosphatase 12-like isoform X2 [Pollicipes pollicipes]|uniref:dual specificity protein phosphatase 12-like isoform X2 n=1 Tax=Pollicipes pollicipes TaxID=41117 RepID=UPI00188530F1|nr:dual specificity protein phosphatase 12-like isoform X2 [Pollicipes pollicipes]